MTLGSLCDIPTIHDPQPLYDPFTFRNSQLALRPFYVP